MYNLNVILAIRYVTDFLLKRAIQMYQVRKFSTL